MRVILEIKGQLRGIHPRAGWLQRGADWLQWVRPGYIGVRTGYNNVRTGYWLIFLRSS